jgi:ABC-2 type transport system permease protein
LTADFPFRVYSGHIPQNEAIIGIFEQFVWLMILVWLGRAAMNKVLRRVVVQGG